jgi:hypothetical protein
LLHYDEAFKEEKDAFNKTKVFFSLFFFLGFKVFVFFFLAFWISFGLQKFHESLINLLLLLGGCAIDNVSSHVGIGGEFCLFKIFKKLSLFSKLFLFCKSFFLKMLRI